MKKLLQPKVLIPVILSVALVVALLAFADLLKVLALIDRFNRLALVWFMLLMLAYEIIRGVQWHVLLTALDVRVPLRTQVFSFAIGEVTKSMPIGNYVQNYVLQQSKGTDFGRTSAATTLIILLEVAISLVGVVILGLGSWTGWLRPVILVGTAVVAAGAWAYHRFHQHARTPRWIKEHKMLRKAMDEVRQFREGAADLLHPRVLLGAGLLGAGYLVAAGVALYVVVRGLGVGGISFSEVLAVYFFSLAFSLIVPLPLDVGVLEISGVGALLAVGADKNAAVGALLLNRVLSLAAALVIAAVVIALLHGEFRAALHHEGAEHRPSPATIPPAGDQG